MFLISFSRYYCGDSDYLSQARIQRGGRLFCPPPLKIFCAWKKNDKWREKRGEKERKTEKLREIYAGNGKKKRNIKEKWKPSSECIWILGSHYYSTSLIYLQWNVPSERVQSVRLIWDMSSKKRFKYFFQVKNIFLKIKNGFVTVWLSLGSLLLGSIQ